MRRLLVSIAVSLAALLSEARGEAAEPDGTAKRPVPDYDGRGTKPEGDGAGIWAARLALSPLYFVSEYLLRRPIGAVTVAAERAELPRKLYDFFAFGPDHKIGWVPVGFLDFGLNPSVGVYGFFDDAVFKHNDLRLHYEVWPDDWLAGSVTDTYHWGRSSLRLRAFMGRRPDQVFYGVGPSTLQSNQSRYTDARFDASAALESHTWRTSRVEAVVGIRKVDLFNGDYGGDPNLQEEAQTGAFAIPFGFDRGYTAPYSRLSVSLDTRRKAEKGSGLHLEVQSEQGADVAHAPLSGWIRYGGDVSAFVDLNQHGRVLGLSVATLFADPLAHGEIPFTELVSLGGDKWMPAYFPRRLVDRSAAVAKLEYAWPVAPWLDGTLQAAVGNVFGEHLEDFKPNLLRLSTAFGLTTTSDPPIQFLVGVGTETFDHGAQFDSVRVSLGVPRLF